MEDWIEFAVIAFAVFAAVAGGGSILVPPDPFLLAPIGLVALAVSVPFAYWTVYLRDGPQSI